MKRFSDYIIFKDKNELLGIFEKENLDFSKYDIDLIIENRRLSTFKKALLAGASIAALASPYLLKKHSDSTAKTQEKSVVDNKPEIKKDIPKPWFMLSDKEQEELWKRPDRNKIFKFPLVK